MPKLIGFEGIDGFGTANPAEYQEVLAGCPGKWIWMPLHGDSRCANTCPPSPYLEQQVGPNGEKWCVERTDPSAPRSSSSGGAISTGGQASLSVEDSGIKWILAGIAIAGVIYMVMKP